MARYSFDHTHSHVGFMVRHMIVSKVRGEFGKWDGELEFDAQDPAATRVSVRIEAASIETRNQQRDTHLRSADFFDAANHPALTFTSKRVDGTGDGRFRIVGDLTIRGTTKEVALETEFNGSTQSPYGDERAGFSAKASIDRREFGLTWNAAIETGSVVVGDKIEITIEIEAVRQVVAKAA